MMLFTCSWHFSAIISSNFPQNHVAMHCTPCQTLYPSAARLINEDTTQRERKKDKTCSNENVWFRNISQSSRIQFRWFSPFFSLFQFSRFLIRYRNDFKTIKCWLPGYRVIINREKKEKYRHRQRRKKSFVVNSQFVWLIYTPLSHS